MFLSIEFRVDGCKLIIRSKDNSPLTSVFDSVELLEAEARAVPPEEQSGKLGKHESELLERLLQTQAKKEKPNG
jgi:hypothetical protein